MVRFSKNRSEPTVSPKRRDHHANETSSWKMHIEQCRYWILRIQAGTKNPGTNLVWLSEVHWVLCSTVLQFDECHGSQTGDSSIFCQHPHHKSGTVQPSISISPCLLCMVYQTGLTAVAEIVDNDLGYKVLRYNHYMLKGDLEEKKGILKWLTT